MAPDMWLDAADRYVLNQCSWHLESCNLFINFSGVSEPLLIQGTTFIAK